MLLGYSARRIPHGWEGGLLRKVCVMKSSSGRVGSTRAFALCLASSVTLAACGDSGADEGAGSRANAGASAAVVEPDSERARSVVERLRSTYLVGQRGPFGHSDPSAPANKLATASQKPLIESSSSARFVRAHERLEAKWEDEPSVDVWVPIRSSYAFGLRDRASGVAVEAKLDGARDVTAAVTEGLAVYEGAGPTGGTIVHRLTEGGTEDYVTFETRPEVGELGYELSLIDVAGLRLVENTLELVDVAGTPRLRISPPFVVGARGEVVEATLSLVDCAADYDPSGPWERLPVAPGSERCRVEVRWDVDAVSYPAIVDPSWSTTGSMSTARLNFIGAAMSNNRVLVSGGYSATLVPLSSAELYNPNTRTWAATASMGTARANHAAALRGNGQVLVTGGVSSSGALASAETYSTSTGTWTTRSPMNVPRSNHRLTTLSNGDVLVSGGNGDGTTAAQRFSNTASTWSSAGNMLSVIQQHTATLLSDGRVLVVGNSAPFGQLFQPSNNTWAATANQPELRFDHVAVRLTNGDVLVAGGASSNYNGLGAEIWSPSSGLWKRTGSPWVPHVTGPTGALLSDGRVLLVGGSGNTDNRTNSEIFDPTWGTWRPGPSLSNRRYAISARLQNNRVLIAGGTTNGSTPVASATEFIPTTTATSIGSYKFPAAIDPEVRPGIATELWAAVYRPTTLPSGRLPVLVFLHGQHHTCGEGSNPRHDWSDEYTYTGVCPPPADIIVESHLGYEYVATELASRGYLVVSINANRGINGDSGPPDDFGLIYARARLVLKHLQRLSDWNRGVSATPGTIGVSLSGKLDLTQVGLMGHSRGGEAMRTAYNLYRASGSPWPARIVDPVTFRGIFEIGPTEFLGSENAVGTSRAVLLPMCDGDNFELQGVQAFDRMMALSETTPKLKATYTVWGANHNFYNSEWEESEPTWCLDHSPIFESVAPGITGSAEQRQTGFQPMLAFFLANVGNTNAPIDTWFNNLFNPESAWSFRPTVDRGYTPGLGTSTSRMLEDFLNGTGTSSFGIANVHSNVTVTHDIIPEHASSLRGGNIAWASPGGFFQTNFANSGAGLNLTSYQVLDLRVDRGVDPGFNVEPFTDFTVRLVNSNNTLSAPLSVRSFLGGGELTGPVGVAVGPSEESETKPHRMLQTARFPLAAFTGATLSSIRGVRLTFSATPSGRIYVANIRASRSTL
jgi:hypothetical protein